jgi:hypothetical protein
VRWGSEACRHCRRRNVLAVAISLLQLHRRGQTGLDCSHPGYVAFFRAHQKAGAEADVGGRAWQRLTDYRSIWLIWIATELPPLGYPARRATVTFLLVRLLELHVMQSG